MDEPARKAEELVSEIQELCKLAEDGGKGDTRSKTLEERLLRQIEDLKRTNKELSKNSNLLQSIMGAMHSGISIRDLDYTITYQNDVVTNIFGNRTGEKCYKAYEGKEEVCEGCPVELAYKDGRSHTSERKVVSPLGETMYWENTANPIRDAEGNIVSCIEMCENITERKKAEEQLRFLSGITEQIADSVITTDLNYKITYTNHAFQELCGYSRDEFIGQSPDVLNVSPNSQEIQQDIYETVSSGGTWRGEAENRRKDGSTFPCEMTIFPLKDKQGNIFAYGGTQRDISKRKLAEEEMLRYACIVSSSNDMMAMLDANFVYLAANEAYLAAFGLAKDRVVGHTAVEVFGEEFFESTIRPHAERCLAGDEVQYENWFEFPVLGSRFMSVRYSQYIDQDGKKECFVVNARDITDRKKAEESLSRSEERYRILVERNPYGIQEIDTSGTIKFANRAHHQIYGYEQGQLVGRTVADFFALESQREELPDYLAMLVKDQPAPTPYHQKIVSGQGEERDIEVIWNYLRDSEGSVTGFLSVLTDIAERMRTEEAILQEKQRLEDVADSVECGLMLLDSKAGIIYANKFVEEWFSPADGMLGRCCCEVMQMDTKDCPAQEVIKTGQKARSEMFATMIDGQEKVFQMAASPIKDSDGNLSQITKVIIDITESKQAERLLRQNEERFRLMYEESPIGYQSLDSEGRFVDVNQAWLSLLGYEKEEVLGRSFANFLASGFPELFMERFPCFKAAGEVSDVAFEMVKKDGGHIDVEIDGRIGYNPDGSFRRTHCVLHDVTERKKSEKELEQHRAELAHAWRVSTMGEMASGIAHELNQPLCAILNYASACARIMKRQTDESGEIGNALQEISSQADRAGNIIRRLRTMVAKGKPRQSTVCINEVIEEVLEMEKTEARDKKITIHKELADNLPSVFSDPVQIEQVVLNIVRNAFDAMENTAPDKRQVTIHTSVGEGNSIEVAVSDTGMGLSPEVEQKLFEPFFTSKANGLGVGLSLSRSIIEAHGGKLWAQPHKDGGATFKFTLPVGERGKENTGNKA